MPVTLSIKNAPDAIVDRLRLQAERHHRSLQGEMLAILEAAVGGPAVQRRAVYEEIRALGLKTDSDSVAIIRADRDSR